jgi:hypothetical protein
MKIWLHIGTGKTGSSAIQGFLNLNRKQICAYSGLLYPNTDAEIPTEGDCHNHSAFIGKRPEAYQKLRMETMVAYAESHRLKGIVLSSEAPNPRQWKPLLDHIKTLKDLEMGIVVYLRRQDHYLESAWKEWGNKDGAGTFSEYLDKQMPVKNGERVVRSGSLLNYHHLLNQWATELPAATIQPRVYEREQLQNGDVVSDFLQCLGIPLAEDYHSPASSRLTENKGMCPSVVELMGLGWGRGGKRLDHLAKTMVYQALGSGVKKQPFEHYPFLSPANRIAVLRAVEDTNRKVAQTWLGRKDGTLFYEPWPDPEEPWSAPQVPDEVLMEHLLRLLADLRSRRKRLIKKLGRKLHPRESPARADV